MADNVQLSVEVGVRLLEGQLDQAVKEVEGAGKDIDKALQLKGAEDSFTRLAQRAERALDDVVAKAVRAGQAIERALEPKKGSGVERALPKPAAAASTQPSSPTEGAEKAARELERIGRSSGGLDEVIRRSEGAKRSIAGLGSEAEFTVGSLLKIGGAAVGIYSVGQALIGAVRDAHDFDASLRGVYLTAVTLPAQIEEIKQKSADLARSLGVFTKEQISQGYLAAAAGGKTGEQADVLVRAAVPLAIDRPDQLAQGVAQLADIIENYRENIFDATSIQNEFFVGAREAGGSVDKLREAVARTSVAFNQFGASRTEAIATFAAAKKVGAEFNDSSLAAAKLVSIITDEGDSLHRTFVQHGADISENTLRTKGWIYELEQIKKTADRTPGLLAAAFGDPKSQRGALALIEGASRARDIVETVRTDVTALDQATAKALNTQSAQIDRTLEGAKSIPAVIGQGLADLASYIAGSSFEPEVELKIAPEIRGFDVAVRKSIDSADIEGAIRQANDFETLGRDKGLEFLRGMRDSLEGQRGVLGRGLPAFPRGLSQTPDDVLFAGQISNFQALDRLNERIQKSSPIIEHVDGQLRQVVGVARNAQGEIEKILSEPLEIGVTPPTPADLERQSLQRRIADTLKAIGPVEVPLSLRVLPEDVRQAQARLQALSSKLGTNALITDQDKAQFSQDQSILKQFHAQELQARQLELSLQARITDGIGKQRAENAALEAQIEAQIKSYRDAGIAVEDLVDLLEQVRTKGAANVEEALAKQTADLDSRILQTRAVTVERARELARATGDVALADALSKDLIDAKAEAQRAANAILIEGLRKQLQGNEEALEQLESYGRALAELVAGEGELARASEKRALLDRARATSNEFAAGRGELLQGLDAELFAIERNREAKELSLRESVRAGTLEAGSLEGLIDLYDRLGERDQLLARSQAAFSQVDEITRAQGATSAGYEANVRAIELSREAERNRVEESLRNAGAEIELIEARLALFDQETAARQRAAAISFAGRSSAELAQQELLNQAYRDARQISDELGESREQALQREIDLISQATFGTEAWTRGLEAGLNDALRSLNDFDEGARTTHDLVLGFRDSISQAFQGLGQDGRNFFQDLAVANLRNLQKAFGDLAADKLTLAIFGQPDANKVDPLDQSASQLYDAGTEMLSAAFAWQDLALQFGATPPLPDVGTGGNLDEYSSIGGGGGGGDEGATEGAGLLESAGEDASQAMAQGGAAAGRALVQGGDAAGAALSKFLFSFGDKFGGALGDAATSALGFARGGIFDGVPVAEHSGLSPRANRVGGTYKSRTLIEVAEVPGLQEAVIPLQGGAVPVELRGRRDPTATARIGERDRGDGGGRERAPVTVAPVVNLGGINITVSGKAADDPKLLAREVAEQARQAVAAALESGSDRRLIEAVRGARA